MGIYLNPNNENFTRTTKREIYVDKTMMISVLNGFMEVDNTYICVSRPRRFGKTIAGNMLSAYYSKGCDSRELFAPYKISGDKSFESNLNKLNVIKIDMNSEYRNVLDEDKLLDELQDSIRAEFSEQFPDVAFTGSDTVGKCILKAYSQKGEKFVIIIDEYDVLVRESVSQQLFDQYLSFLSGLFKSNTLRPAIALAYITGILPVVRDRIQSKLNNFDEYTILDAAELAVAVVDSCMGSLTSVVVGVALHILDEEQLLVVKGICVLRKIALVFCLVVAMDGGQVRKVGKIFSVFLHVLFRAKELRFELRFLRGKEFLCSARRLFERIKCGRKISRTFFQFFCLCHASSLYAKIPARHGNAHPAGAVCEEKCRVDESFATPPTPPGLAVRPCEPAGHSGGDMRL